MLLRSPPISAAAMDPEYNRARFSIIRSEYIELDLTVADGFEYNSVLVDLGSLRRSDNSIGHGDDPQADTPAKGRAQHS